MNIKTIINKPVQVPPGKSQMIIDFAKKNNLPIKLLK